jgi:DNA-binding CsgD family transcriptional regulator/tetratricopeptide (TPR) repeat protein
VDSAFVGREREVALLRAAREASRSGRPALVLVGGEAGSGRSLTVATALEGGAVLLGRCVPLTGTALPYGPWVDVLRALPGESRVVRGGPRVGSARLETDHELARAELLDEVQTALGAAARECPLAVVLEDMHWADRASIDALMYVASKLRDEPLLVVATFRSDSIAGTDWAAGLAELGRLPVTTRVELSGLGLDDVAALVSAHRPEPAEDGDHRALAARILAASGGNAFFASQLVADPSWLEGAGGLPVRLRDVVAGRVRSLSPGARDVLEVMSVLGRPVADSVVGQAAGEGFVDALHELVASGLVVADRAQGTLAVRYGVIRSFLYDTLLPLEQRRLHARVAEALDLAGGTDVAALAERADHWFRAGEPGHALPAAVRAGRGAVDVVAAELAWCHLGRAVSLWERAPGAPDCGVTHVELLALAAGAARWCGDPGSAADLVRTALGEAASDEVRAALEERLGRYLYEAGDVAGSRAAYERAAALLAGSPPSALAAQVAAALASLSMLRGAYAAAAAEARAAFGLARSADAPLAAAYALSTLGVCLSVTGQTDRTGAADPSGEAVEVLREAADVARQADDVESIMRVDIALAVALERSGRLTEALEVARRALERARSYRLTGSFGVVAAANALDLMRVLGLWSEADALAADGLDGPASPSHQAYLLSLRAALSVARGELERARADLDRAAGLADLDEPDSAVPHLLARAELALWSGRTREAVGHSRRAFDLAATTDEPTLAAWTSAMLVRALVDDGALATDDLVPAVPALPAVDAAAVQARCWLLTAAAERTRVPAGRADAARAWALAAAAWAEVARPYEEAYCRLREGEAALAAGERRTARTPLARAHALAGTLGARPIAQEVEATARRARIRLGGEEPAPPAPPSAVPTRDGEGPLTGRESEVLHLLELGLTNRQIARRLFLSERTVGVHVSNILRKLGARNRGEAAALARRADRSATT